jgi:hypothetical protein
MSALFESIVQYLQADQWPVLVVPNQPIAVTGFHGKNGQWECQLHLREEQRQIVFYSICPVTVPHDKRVALAEFITRANYGLVIGNLELDMNDGEVRYKTSREISSDTLAECLSPLLYANVLSLDRYLPGIRLVIDGNVSPAEACAVVENAESILNS